jgi:hypothetical protein
LMQSDHSFQTHAIIHDDWDLHLVCGAMTSRRVTKSTRSVFAGIDLPHRWRQERPIRFDDLVMFIQNTTTKPNFRDTSRQVRRTGSAQGCQGIDLRVEPQTQWPQSIHLVFSQSPARLAGLFGLPLMGGMELGNTSLFLMKFSPATVAPNGRRRPSAPPAEPGPIITHGITLSSTRSVVNLCVRKT